MRHIGADKFPGAMLLPPKRVPLKATAGRIFSFRRWFCSGDEIDQGDGGVKFKSFGLT
jgi:hypothetical protein